MFLGAADGLAIAAAFEPKSAHLFEPFLELLMAGLAAGTPPYYREKSQERPPATGGNR